MILDKTKRMEAITPKKTRIVVIGVGAVGSTTAYTLLLRQRMDELVLIDSNKEKAIGDVLDMNHGLPFLGKAKVWAGSYEDCRDADIIVISAGVAQRPGESRVELLKRNVSIYESIIKNLLQYNTSGILLVATNPVDIISYFTWTALILLMSRQPNFFRQRLVLPVSNQ